MIAILSFVSLAGCGRVGFDAIAIVPPDAADDSAVYDAEIDAGIPPRLPIHWYRFDGTGTDVTDAEGSANGTVLGGATLSGSGTLALAGGTSEQYVDLPNGILSSLTSVTVESWVVWNGDTKGVWQRIFDFGNSNGGEDVQGNGTRHFSLTVTTGGELRLVFDVNPLLNSTDWRAFWVTDALPTGSRHQLVATFDDAPSPSTIALYLDGALLDTADVPDTESLSQLDDVNCWLGRGQWSSDAELDGTLHDVRIYDFAMTQAEIVARFTRGPDVP